MTVTVVCQNENASVRLDGSLKAPKPKAAASKSKPVTLEPLTVELQPGVPVTVDIPVAGKGKKLIKKALKGGGKPKGTVTAIATDDLGASTPHSVDVKYRTKEVAGRARQIRSVRSVGWPLSEKRLAKTH